MTNFAVHSYGFILMSETFAEIAQLVERNLAKVEVAGPSPVFRSTKVIGNGGLFSYVSRLCGDTFVYISELGYSGKAVIPFRPVLVVTAESRKIR